MNNVPGRMQMPPPPPLVDAYSNTLNIPDYFPEIQPLVFDCGSFLSKCGFSGDEFPRAALPTVVGRVKNGGLMVGMDAKDCFVGDEAVAKRGILKLKYPIDRGTIMNWNDMEKIWHHIFYNELRVTPEEHSVAYLTHPITPLTHREKICSIMFETFNVISLSLLCRPCMTLRASGRLTGLVVNAGGGTTEVAAVYEGHMLELSAERCDLGYEVGVNYLSHLLGDRGYDMTTSAERDILRDIVQKHCRIPLDYDDELIRSEAMGDLDMTYELPDDSLLNFGHERIKVGEFYWNPSVVTESIATSSYSYQLFRSGGSETLDLGTGIQNLVLDALLACPSDLHELLLHNIVVGGAGNNIPGFAERLRREVQIALESRPSLSSVDPRWVRVNTPTTESGNDQFAAWIGASLLSSESQYDGARPTSADNMDQRWIQKEIYDDYGASIVHRMF